MPDNGPGSDHRRRAWGNALQAGWLAIVVAGGGWALWALPGSIVRLVQVVENRAGALTGSALPSMLIGDVAGRHPELAQLAVRLQGRSALVLIFDTGCGHCDLNMPRWLELAHAFRQSGVPVLALSSQSRSAAVQYWGRFAAVVEIHAQLDRRVLAALFRVRGTPCTALVRDGIVVKVFHGALDRYRQSWLLAQRT